MNEYLRLLGLKVHDAVTGFEGIVTSITFDLYGCVQALVSPGMKDGKIVEREWFDTKRLSILDSKPVMPVPTFAAVPGPEDKPSFTSMPKPE